ncbi:hypothetical protein [Methyloglobulus sp.]|uniref:IS66 family insertion sequence element accessory protein TnpA n=1 Tax=Methyloglobulus sp. TaxID=2518622 RepID=UPI0032B852BD
MSETSSEHDKTDNKSLTEQEQYWLDHYHRWQQSGFSLAGYARSQGLLENTFYGWHARLKQRGLAKPEPAPTVFHRVAIKSPDVPISDKTDDGITSLRFRLPNGIDCEITGIKPSSFADLLEMLACIRL